MRNTFRYASRKDWDELARDLRPVYTAPSAEMAGVRFDEFADKWGARYPAIINLWRSAWEEFIVFLDYDVEIRKIICSTNAIESLNARYRRAVRARGHSPDRPGRTQMPLPRHPLPRPHRPRTSTVDDALEAGAQRLRDHLRRPYRSQHHQLNRSRPVTPLIGQTPSMPPPHLFCR
jgi:putative transposase